MARERTDGMPDRERITPGDAFNCDVVDVGRAYRRAKATGIAIPVILIDAPDPDHLEDVTVGSRERAELIPHVGPDYAGALLRTPADRLSVLVLFGDRAYGYEVDVPVG